MKALFIWGGWPGHGPTKCRDIIVPWLKEQGFDVPEVLTIMKRGMLWSAGIIQ